VYEHGTPLPISLQDDIHTVPDTATSSRRTIAINCTGERFDCGTSSIPCFVLYYVLWLCVHEQAGEHHERRAWPKGVKSSLVDSRGLGFASGVSPNVWGIRPDTKTICSSCLMLGLCQSVTTPCT
jgi:hypothetical protein